MRTAKSTMGFTLVEVLIIAPMVILLIGVFIALAVGLTGESLQVREKNTIVYDVQAALDIIEEDASRAISFPLSISSPEFPLVGSQTAASAASANTLLIKAAATTTNPLASTRQLVYIASTSANCSAANVQTNPYQTVAYAYFVDSSKSLWRRTFLGSTAAGYACSTAWQKASCSTCSSRDTKLVENVSSMDVKLYDEAGDEEDVPTDGSTSWTDIDTPSTVRIDITVDKLVSGENISHTGSLQVSSINIK